MSVALDTKLASLESDLSALIGATTLSDPKNNISDPLVQIAIHALGGLVEVEDAVEEFKNGFDIKTASCACLYILASLVGEERRDSKRSTATIVFHGTSGTVIPAGTTFSDRFGGSWVTESEVKLTVGWGWGTVQSEVGAYNLSADELEITTEINNIVYSNSVTTSVGYASEDCESFRTRLMSGGGLNIPETEKTIIERIEALGTRAKFIADAPECLSDYTRQAFVVNGGTTEDIARIIREYAPVNYTALAGNEYHAPSECEEIRILRPDPVGIEIKYWAKAEIEDQVFLDKLCEVNCTSDTVTAMTFADIPTLTKITLRPIYSRNGTVASTDVVDATDCYGSVSLISDDCYRNGSVVDQEETNCIKLESWQYPVFVSAEQVGTTC